MAIRLLFTKGSRASEIAIKATVSTLINCRFDRNERQRNFSVFYHDLGLILECDDECNAYLPTNCAENEQLGTFRLPNESIQHAYVNHGYCVICGHHGQDCRGVDEAGIGACVDCGTHCVGMDDLSVLCPKCDAEETANA